MKSRNLPLVFLVFLTACLAGCGGSQSHPLKGVVVEVIAEPPALLVDHEEIPGFMAAMTMRFTVDAATVTKVKPGDAITGRLRFRDGTWQLEDVRATPRP